MIWSTVNVLTLNFTSTEYWSPSHRAVLDSLHPWDPIPKRASLLWGDLLCLIVSKVSVLQWQGVYVSYPLYGCHQMPNVNQLKGDRIWLLVWGHNEEGMVSDRSVAAGAEHSHLGRRGTEINAYTWLTFSLHQCPQPTRCCHSHLGQIFILGNCQWSP